MCEHVYGVCMLTLLTGLVILTSWLCAHFIISGLGFNSLFRLNHNKGSKSVPLLMKNQLSSTPFILLPIYSISYHFFQNF